MKRSNNILLLFLILFTLPAKAVNLPQVNLGATSFMDAVGGPVTLLETSLSQYSGNEFIDSEGKAIPGSNKFKALSMTSLIVHVTKKKIFGGYYGMQALIPVVNIDPNTDFGLNKNETGIGDLVISPLIIQWPEQQLFDKPFWQRFNLLISLPTGKYNEKSDVSIGNNAVSLNPYYAFTWQWAQRWETSARIHYLWNGKNTKPLIAENSKSTQAGEAIHTNFATSYQLNDKWRIGVSGYYLTQITNHRKNNTDVNNSKEKVFAIGPGFSYSHKDIAIRLNAYSESSVENRTKGSNITMTLTQLF